MTSLHPTGPFKSLVVLGESTVQGGGWLTKKEERWADILARLIEDAQEEPLRYHNAGLGASVISPHSPDYEASVKPSAVERLQTEVLDHQPDLDGLMVYVQATNAAGDPVHTAGTILVELFAFRPASADHKGDRIGVWTFPLQSQADQATRWNRATQMYELPAALPPDTRADQTAARYVLAVTLNPPLGDRRFDEYILDAPPATSAFTSQP